MPISLMIPANSFRTRPTCTQKQNRSRGGSAMTIGAFPTVITSGLTTRSVGNVDCVRMVPQLVTRRAMVGGRHPGTSKARHHGATRVWPLGGFHRGQSPLVKLGQGKSGACFGLRQGQGWWWRRVLDGVWMEGGGRLRAEEEREEGEGCPVDSLKGWHGDTCTCPEIDLAHSPLPLTYRPGPLPH